MLNEEKYKSQYRDLSADTGSPEMAGSGGNNMTKATLSPNAHRSTCRSPRVGILLSQRVKWPIVYGCSLHSCLGSQDSYNMRIGSVHPHSAG